MVRSINIGRQIYMFIYTTIRQWTWSKIILQVMMINDKIFSLNVARLSVTSCNLHLVANVHNSWFEILRTKSYFVMASPLYVKIYLSYTFLVDMSQNIKYSHEIHRTCNSIKFNFMKKTHFLILVGSVFCQKINRAVAG